MQITPSEGAFAAARALLEQEKNSASAAPKLDIQPTMNQQLLHKEGALASSLAAQTATSVNMHGQQLGKVLNVKA